MALATVGAFATGEYPEAVFVMLFYQVGELFQSYAVGRSRQSISQLMEIRRTTPIWSATAKRRRSIPTRWPWATSSWSNPAERVPLDGVVLEGRSTLDTAALTGESLPRDVGEGDDVISGCVNQSGLLRVRVTKAFGESTVSKILDLVETPAAKRRARELHHQICPRVHALRGHCRSAAGGGALARQRRLERVDAGAHLLVVSCPCALVISVPLSFFGGIGGASRDGILVKGGSYLETLSQAEIVVFDKTGTLTKGVFNVTAIHPDQNLRGGAFGAGGVRGELFRPSHLPLHPRGLRRGHRPKSRRPGGGAGRARRTRRDRRQNGVRGNSKLMDELGAKWHPCHHVGTTVHVEVDGLYAGHLVISDEVKPDAADGHPQAEGTGRAKDGDAHRRRAGRGRARGRGAGADEVHAQLLPAGKVERVEALLNEKSDKGALVFVGDGINDAPVLSRADVGVAMAAWARTQPSRLADVVFMDDKPSKLADAIRIARKTRAIVRQNVVFALAVSCW